MTEPTPKRAKSESTGPYEAEESFTLFMRLYIHNDIIEALPDCKMKDALNELEDYVMDRDLVSEFLFSPYQEGYINRRKYREIQHEYCIPVLFKNVVTYRDMRDEIDRIVIHMFGENKYRVMFIGGSARMLDWCYVHGLDNVNHDLLCSGDYALGVFIDHSERLKQCCTLQTSIIKSTVV